ncbi:hypothetical protein LCGC14_2341160 [marine sediment metagenome]|uniref:glutamine--fructose-6-phosphate transaminase (isomerizing) n=1 Tax=marine sediment metagenome TaxID=412755 RepID=A0A0F9CZJ0_9ZZZZ
MSILILLKKYLRKNPHIVIGHTRFATSGTITPENAHPFKWGQILGAHNGIVSNYLEIDHKVNVDSEAIFRLLSRNSNDFIKTFKRLSGQFAISWVDLKDPDSVYLVRHDNPLFCAVVPQLSTIFWSSVWGSLDTEIEKILGKHNKVNTFLFGVDKTYKIDSKLQIKKTRIEFKPYVYNGSSAYEYAGYDHASKEYDSREYESDDDLSDTPLFATPKDKVATTDFKKEIASEFGCHICKEIVGDGFWFDDDKQLVICRNHYYTYKHKGPLSWTTLYPSDLVDFKSVHRTI